MEEARKHGSTADWRLRNPGWDTEARHERRLAITRAWRARNPDWTREWRLRNPDAEQARRAAAHANADARRRSTDGRLRPADIRALWERQPVCVRCGTGRGLDHVIALADGGANEPGNLQNLCYGCNSAKEYEAKKTRERERGPGGEYC